MAVIRGPWPDPGERFQSQVHACDEDTWHDTSPCLCCGQPHVRCLVCGQVVQEDQD